MSFHGVTGQNTGSPVEEFILGIWLGLAGFPHQNRCLASLERHLGTYLACGTTGQDMRLVGIPRLKAILEEGN
jgi:hypothetical protein